MDKEESSSSGQGGLKTAVQPATGFHNNGKKQTKSNTKPRRRQRGKIKPEIIIGLITAFLTAITSIVVALITSQATKPAPISTFAPIFSPQVLITDSPTISVDFTSTSISKPVTFSPTETPTYTPVAISTEILTITASPAPKLIVLLSATKNSGRAPLKVKFDARASYMTDYDGQTYVCRNGPCHYTWKVYSNGQQMGKSVNGSGGTFDYTFGKQGTYMVTVWICRGQDKVDCGGSGVQIVVTK